MRFFLIGRIADGLRSCERTQQVCAVLAQIPQPFWLPSNSKENPNETRSNFS